MPSLGPAISPAKLLDGFAPPASTATAPKPTPKAAAAAASSAAAPATSTATAPKTFDGFRLPPANGFRLAPKNSEVNIVIPKAAPKATNKKATPKKSPKEKPKCNVNDCNKGRRFGAYCTEHFKIFEPDKQKVEEVLAKEKAKRTCIKEGCGKTKKGKCGGYCGTCFEEVNLEGGAALAASATKESVDAAIDAVAALAGGGGESKASTSVVSPATKGTAESSAAAKPNSNEPSAPSQLMSNKRVSKPSSKLLESKSVDATTPKAKKQKTDAQSKKKSAGKSDSTEGGGAKCELVGCTKYRQANCHGYCTRHSKLAKQLSLDFGMKKSLKPQYKARSKVYAAYWLPEDEKRKGDPQWYPGVVSSFKISKVALDEQYGFVRYYNIHYEDGDTCDNVAEHFVMDKEEYLLQLRHDDDEDGSKKKKKKGSWKGVKNATDKKSKDLWAKHVGWYEVNADGEEFLYSTLSDALRGYDASVVREKGLKTKRRDLNLPEDWEVLFSKSKDDDEEEVQKGTRKMPPELMGSGQVLSEPVPTLGPQWTRQVRVTPRGPSKFEYVSPFGTRFKNVEEAQKYVKLQDTELAELNDKEKKDEESKQAAIEKFVASKTQTPKNDEVSAEKKTNQVWSYEEIETIITLDEQLTQLRAGERYKRMGQALPQRKEYACGKKIQELRKQVCDGKTIQSIIGLMDIKATLSQWSKEKIDLLMQLETQHKDQPEYVKDAKIAQALPRWESDSCSFKTLYMRWQIRVRREGNEKKRKREESEVKKSKEESAAV